MSTLTPRGKNNSSKTTPRLTREKDKMPEKEPEPDYYALDLRFVNIINNIYQTRSVYSKDELA